MKYRAAVVVGEDANNGQKKIAKDNIHKNIFRYFPKLGKIPYICPLRIITKKRLEVFGKEYTDAKTSLKFWYDIVTANSFYSVQEVIQVFNTADYVGNERIVFNIAHNKYRLIAKFRFHIRAQRVYIRFIGTHAEYDKIKDIEYV